MYGVQVQDLPNDDVARDSISDAVRFGFEGGAFEYGGGFIGLWVAVGGGGNEHAARLQGSIGFKLTPEGVRHAFPEDVAACEAAWPAFVAHMKEHGGIELIGEPKLFLVATETA